MPVPQQAFLMRAYRSIDGSFFTWRAGQYDPNLLEATPPHPKVEYSDPVVLGFVGGPLARTDAEGFTLAGLGTSGTPVTFATSPGTIESDPGTDCRDFSSITYWVYITAPGTASSMELRVRWASVDAAVAADFTTQKSDDAITSGVSPQNTYVGQFTIPGSGTIGPFNVPVRGRRAELIVETDTGDLDGYVVAMRIA